MKAFVSKECSDFIKKEFGLTIEEKAVLWVNFDKDNRLFDDDNHLLLPAKDEEGNIYCFKQDFEHLSGNRYEPGTLSLAKYEKQNVFFDIKDTLKQDNALCHEVNTVLENQAFGKESDKISHALSELREAFSVGKNKLFDCNESCWRWTARHEDSLRSNDTKPVSLTVMSTQKTLQLLESMQQHKKVNLKRNKISKNRDEIAMSK